MKICFSCKESKETSEFRSRGKGRLQSKCKDCHKEYDKIWHQKNKERRNSLKLKAQKIRAERIKSFVRSIKDIPCKDCQNSFPFYVMQYDHISNNKVGNIANMVARAFSMQTILDEIAKCELVCANCHAIRTWNRRLNVGESPNKSCP